ncbi:MAG: tripartite tricarboxylate transporter TctB family protein [Pseudomonadota bacterium]
MSDNAPSARGMALGDLIFAAAMIAVAVVVWVGTADLPPPRYEPLGSAAIPRAVALLMAGLSLIIAVRAVFAPAPAAGEPAGGKAVARVVALSAALLLYVALMDARVVGFRAASIPFLTATGVILAGVSLRNLLFSAAFAVFLTLTVHTTFTRFFYIDLP